mmetsp:Transcript_60189/g.142051  ORF Transcript_60189/g.142051 Transcript_60189/m.142051 type:complete len:318 (-) Transcript_60189:4250-5203(-)
MSRRHGLSVGLPVPTAPDLPAPAARPCHRDPRPARSLMAGREAEQHRRDRRRARYDGRVRDPRRGRVPRHLRGRCGGRGENQRHDVHDGLGVDGARRRWQRPDAGLDLGKSVQKQLADGGHAASDVFQRCKALELPRRRRECAGGRVRSRPGHNLRPSAVELEANRRGGAVQPDPQVHQALGRDPRRESGARRVRSERGIGAACELHDLVHRRQHRGWERDANGSAWRGNLRRQLHERGGFGRGEERVGSGSGSAARALGSVDQDRLAARRSQRRVLPPDQHRARDPRGTDRNRRQQPRLALPRHASSARAWLACRG